MALNELQKCIVLEKLPIDLRFHFEAFKKQLSIYLDLISPTSNVILEETNRYTSEIKQVKVMARKKLKKKNEKIQCLEGVSAKLTVENESFLAPEGNDFSIIRSSKSKSVLLLLGAVAFVNHDCDSNSVYSVNDKNKIFIESKRPSSFIASELCGW